MSTLRITFTALQGDSSYRDFCWILKIFFSQVRLNYAVKLAYSSSEFSFDITSCVEEKRTFLYLIFWQICFE